ncbi:PREDICTED: esterase E4-like [Papilio polytes]|uniref:esterase E4-like n=1 Tax=Papilio polytes TaxID=76194 RepID=UPI000675D1D0|nr:PREDICTED: esterase E4-like [Papilio polytes]
MWWIGILFFGLVYAEGDFRTVELEQGFVRGEKFWDGDYYEFFGVPYATAPTGRDKYKGPLPVKTWQGVFDAKVRNTVCYQTYYTGEDDEESLLSGDEDCLVINLLVPKLASEENLVPVMVYIHSGAFSGGNGNMAKFQYLARHDIIVISFNYRLGALGFACLGNEIIPGNAGLKDQVAALKWINKNVIKFGGDPTKVTLAGFSVGASMAELLTFTKSTEGLIDKLILESGSVLSPFTINRDPISTATNIAISMGYNGTGELDDLTEFYLNATPEVLVSKSLNFFLPNSTFGFAPCIENVHEGIEPFLTESPTDILKKGENQKLPVLTGFANMEGISRLIQFGKWRTPMTENFSEFLPVDLKFPDEKTKEEVAKEIKQRYFKGEEVNLENIQSYVDYFSDSMFKYWIMKSAKHHAGTSKKPTYLYEFTYVGNMNIKHNYMDRIHGASHRDQTAYLLDFFAWSNTYKDLDTRDRMTLMWTDFVKYGDPTAYETSLINFKWRPFNNQKAIYLQIDKVLTMKRNLFQEEYKFWDKIYEKYYWNPEPPKKVEIKKGENKIVTNENEDKQLKIENKGNQKINKNDSKTEDKKAKIGNENKQVKEEHKNKQGK